MKSMARPAYAFRFWVIGQREPRLRICAFQILDHWPRTLMEGSGLLYTYFRFSVSSHWWMSQPSPWCPMCISYAQVSIWWEVRGSWTWIFRSAIAPQYFPPSQLSILAYSSIIATVPHNPTFCPATWEFIMDQVRKKDAIEAEWLRNYQLIRNLYLSDMSLNNLVYWLGFFENFIVTLYLKAL